MIDADFAGKIVAISGASSGIGLAIAERTVARGGTAVMMARRASVLSEHASQLGASAIPLQMDVTDPDSVRSAFTEIADVHGHLDALVNAAGVQRYRLLAEATDADIADVIGTTLLGPIYTVRAAIPLLAASGGGDIVNLGSEVEAFHLPFASLYSAGKSGLRNLSRSLGRELREQRIRVTHVVVGYTATGLSATIPQSDRAKARSAIAESGYPNYSGGVPMKPEWVADVALFPLTCPSGMQVDLIHARSFGAGVWSQGATPGNP